MTTARLLALPAFLFALFGSSSYEMTIKAGKHDSTLLGIGAPHIGWHVDRTLAFHAVFHADVPYATKAASNQWDWCKLMGLSTDEIHRDSVRLGWRWRPDLKKVEVGLYAYLDGQRTMTPLTTVPLEQELAVELRLWEGGASARAGGAYQEARGKLGLASWVPRITWRLHTAYFGGDETAPHAMHLSARDVHEL